MQTTQQNSLENEFDALGRPKIDISGDRILISDPPFAWRIFLAIFCASLAVVASQFRDQNDKVKGILVGLMLSIGFIYDSLSLQRVKFDFQKRVVYRMSLNPIENLINRLLQRPSIIPFKKIDKIYFDYNEAFGGASQRYYLYIKSGQKDKLRIGTFNKEADANSFVIFLNRKINNVR